MDEYLTVKEKNERKYLKDMKKELFKDSIEAKNEVFINKKLDFFDDLQRSVILLNFRKFQFFAFF